MIEKTIAAAKAVASIIQNVQQAENKHDPARIKQKIQKATRGENGPSFEDIMEEIDKLQQAVSDQKKEVTALKRSNSRTLL